MGIIVRRNEIEQDEPEEPLDIDQCCFNIAVDDPGTLFVTGLVVFVVGSCVVFGISQQGREILLLVFPPVMDIEPARNICRFSVVEKHRPLAAVSMPYTWEAICIVTCSLAAQYSRLMM